MTESRAKEPVEKIEKAAQQVAKTATTSRPARLYRTYLFRFMLIATTGAFAVLTFLVKTTPAFPIDLAITQALQSMNSPFFDGLMTVISWPGFPPQSYLLSALVVLNIWVLGLRWEAVSALVAALLPSIINRLYLK